jgi:hypothetical protein
LFEVEVSRIDPFRSLVKALSVIVEEGTFVMNEAQIKLKLKQTAMAVQARTGVKKVAFKVSLEDGKPKIKVVPVKE